MKKIILILTLCVWLLPASSQTLWSQLGANNPATGDMSRMFVDTIDNTLYLGGRFEYIGGKKCRGAAKWNGTDWDSLRGGFELNEGTNFPDDVRKILRYKNKIYYFGSFQSAGNYNTTGMAIWNGTDWDSAGVYPNGQVLDADVYNDTLYICGGFTKVGSLTTYNAARFDGTTWYPMHFNNPGAGALYGIRAFKNKVYAIGQFYTNGFGLTAEWTQADGWKPSLGIQGDQYKSVFGLERIDTLLYFYGRFTHLSSMYSPYIAAYSGTQLYGFGGTSTTDYSSIENIKKIEDTIYVVGTFDNAARATAQGIGNLGVGLLSGNQWCIYGQQFDNTVSDIVKYNGNKIISGSFWTINGDSIKKIAKWIGGSYTYSCSTFVLSVGVGIKEDKTADFNSISIAPNPFSDKITISLPNNFNFDNASVSVYNNLGQVVYSLNTLEEKQQLMLGNLPAGLYHVKIQSDNLFKTFKVLKD